MGNFVKKVVVITGATKGVGLATARLFASQGAHLVLVARGQTGLDKVTEELSQLTEVLPLCKDMQSEQDCKRVIEDTIEHFAQLDVLVNNAGVHHRGDFNQRSPEQICQMVDVNLKAPLYLTSLALPYIKKSTCGAIAMVGSLAGRTPLQGAATYAATKAGLRSFSYALRDELKPFNIAVGVVSPGPINTGFIMEEIDQVEDIVYSQPMSEPEHVADAILTLCQNKHAEIPLTWFSGKLTTLSYLFPSLRRALRSTLYKIGRKKKEKYRKLYQ